MEKIVAKLHETVNENRFACANEQAEWSKVTRYTATGLVRALEAMGCKIEMEVQLDGKCHHISKINITTPATRTGAAAPQPPQVAELPKTLFLFRPLAEFGEALKESCPPNDCIIYRNIYEMYCTRLADYKRILATCPDLAEGTVRVLESTIYGLMKQLHDMWDTNIAVNRKREAMRAEKEHKARIAAQARE